MSDVALADRPSAEHTVKYRGSHTGRLRDARGWHLRPDDRPTAETWLGAKATAAEAHYEQHDQGPLKARLAPVLPVVCAGGQPFGAGLQDKIAHRCRQRIDSGFPCQRTRRRIG